jgi:hypothetical protein
LNKNSIFAELLNKEQNDERKKIFSLLSNIHTKELVKYDENNQFKTILIIDDIKMVLVHEDEFSGFLTIRDCGEIYTLLTHFIHEKITIAYDYTKTEKKLTKNQIRNKINESLTNNDKKSFDFYVSLLK